jgi:hypothetical protein
VLRCETEQVDRFDDATDELTMNLVEAGVRAWSSRQNEAGPTSLWVLVAPLWGWTSQGAETLPEELADVLAGDKMRSKIAKLERTGCDERHLFLHVRESAFSFAVYSVLAFDGGLPTVAPQLPGGLTQVWLLSGWAAGGVVRAVNEEGWSRTDLSQWASGHGDP